MRIKYQFASILLLMLLDILSGLCKVFFNKETYKSAKMASGLYKKMGTLICLFSALVVDKLATGMLPVQIFTYVWTYSMAMELLSIFENVGYKNLTKYIKGLVYNESKSKSDKSD